MSLQQKLYDLSYDATNQCVQCGYCLPACPTYESMGKESASPRGRINLVKMASEGKIDIDKHLREPIDLCLGCRACETACPVGVPYGHILESAKEVLHDAQHSTANVAQAKKEQGSSKNTDSSNMMMNPLKSKEPKGSKLKGLLMNQLFPYPKRMRAVGNLVWIYQKSMLDRLVRKTKLLNKISEPMAQFKAILPQLESPSKRNTWGTVYPAKGKTKARVAFAAGCIMDAMMYRTNRLTIELLNLVGCEVVIPPEQQCCGALHAHQGMMDKARSMAKANIEAFEQAEVEFYINNAGGCGAMLKEYDHLLAHDPEWSERAKKFVQKSRDISELLVQFGPLPFKKEWPGIITYQDSCHLRNVQGVYTEPRQLLESIPGATFREMEGSDSCCASGGIYNLIHYNESMKILDTKMEKVKDTLATTIVNGNPGCLLQMKLGIKRLGQEKSMQALHLVEVLAEVCGLNDIPEKPVYANQHQNRGIY